MDPRKILDVSMYDDEKTIIKKYNKAIKNATSEFDKKIIYESYKECMKNVSPEIFSENDQKYKTSNNTETVDIQEQGSSLPTFRSQEEFNKFNSLLNSDKSKRNVFLNNDPLVKFDNWFGNNDGPSKNILNTVGKGKTFNNEKFNQLFEEMKEQKATKEKKIKRYEQLGTLDSGLDEYQGVASFGNVMMHTGHKKIESNYSDEDSDAEGELGSGSGFRANPINSRDELFKINKNKLLKEAMYKKQFIEKNSHLFKDGINPEDLHDNFLEEKINNIINPRV